MSKKQSKNGWVKVSTRKPMALPRLGRTVLILYKDHHGRRYMAVGNRVHREYEEFLFVCKDTANNYSTELDSSEVLAWQPLPGKSIK